MENKPKTSENKPLRKPHAGSMKDVVEKAVSSKVMAEVGKAMETPIRNIVNPRQIKKVLKSKLDQSE